jgi:isocitrate lyase
MPKQCSTLLVCSIVADAEAGFGGAAQRAHEIMKAYIEARLPQCIFRISWRRERNHLGGKVLIPTAAHERS